MNRHTKDRERSAICDTYLSCLNECYQDSTNNHHDGHHNKASGNGSCNVFDVPYYEWPGYEAKTVLDRTPKPIPAFFVPTSSLVMVYVMGGIPEANNPNNPTMSTSRKSLTNIILGIRTIQVYEAMNNMIFLFSIRSKSFLKKGLRGTITIIATLVIVETSTMLIFLNSTKNAGAHVRNTITTPLSRNQT